MVPGTVLISPEGVFSANCHFDGSDPVANHLEAIRWATARLKEAEEALLNTPKVLEFARRRTGG